MNKLTPFKDWRLEEIQCLTDAERTELQRNCIHLIRELQREQQPSSCPQWQQAQRVLDLCGSLHFEDWLKNVSTNPDLL